MAHSILTKLFGRLIGLDSSNNLVMRGGSIYYGDDNGPVANGVFNLATGGGGGNAQTAAEVTAGVTPLNTMYFENDVRRYGTSVGTGADDTTAINSTLAVAKVNGRPALFSGLTLKSSGGHIQDIGLCGVDGQGAIINFTTMGGGATAWALAASTPASISPQHSRNPLTRIYFIGTGIGTGLSITVTGTPTTFLDDLVISNGGCENFATDCSIQSYAYIIDFYSWNLTAGTQCLSLLSGTDSAERINFFGGLYGNATNGINNANGNTELHFWGASFDACNVYFTGAGSKTFLHGCHIEFNNPASITTSPFQLTAANTLLCIDGGSMLTDGTAPFGWPSVFSIVSGAEVQLSGGLQLNNIQNTANVLCTGAGQCLINDPIFQLGSVANPASIGGTLSNFSMLRDGGFENAAILDNIAILSDAGSITTRTTSTNISSIATSTAQFRSGAQSLAIVKAGGQAVVGIFVPCKPGYRFSIQGYLYTSANVTGNIFINGNFATGVITAANGIPTVLGGNGLAAQTIASPSTGAWIPWSIGGLGYIAPSWASWFYIAFNIGTGAATYYLDDVVISAM